MSYRHLLCVLGCCVLGASLSYAQNGGESGLAFLRIGTDAAASAMGDAHVAYSHDASATYWNPAGLAAASTNSVVASHQIWVAGVRRYTAAARFRAGQRGGIGLFVDATDSGDLEARDRPGAPTGTFSMQVFSSGVAYGRRIGPLRAGVTAKFLSQRIFEASAQGYAFDVGLQADLLKGGLHLGAAAQHLGEMSELDAEATPLPSTLRAGATVFPFHILAELDGAVVLNVALTAEVSHVIDNETTRVHAGTAIEVMELIVLRAGFITNDALRNATFGLGLNYNAFAFNYALLPFESGFEGPGHTLSLTYHW